MHSIKDILAKILAVCICFFGAFVILGAIANITNPDPLKNDLVAYTFMGLVLGIVPCVLSIWWFISVSKNVKKRQLNEYTGAILRYAQSQEGKITVQEIAVHLNIPFEKASNLLNEMQTKGIFELQLTEKGAYVYSLLHFATLEEKRQAEGL